MFWSVCQTESQRESVAKKFLKQAGYETYLPLIQVKRRVLPLFPAYIFVRIVDRWYSIRWTVGVLRVLTVDGLPAQVSDKIMTAIQRREGENGLIKLPKKPGLQRGQRVRITRGAFENRVGVYDGMSGPDRVKVLIDLMGRDVPVSVATPDVVAHEQAIS